MAVKKLSSKSMLHERRLFHNADDLSRSVTETVRMARGEVRKSEDIIAQSQAAIERARKVLDESRQRRLEVIRKPKSGTGSKA